MHKKKGNMGLRTQDKIAIIWKAKFTVQERRGLPEKIGKLLGGLERSTTSRKLRGKVKSTLDEVQILCKLWGIDLAEFSKAETEQEVMDLVAEKEMDMPLTVENLEKFLVEVRKGLKREPVPQEQQQFADMIIDKLENIVDTYLKDPPPQRPHLKKVK